MPADPRIRIERLRPGIAFEFRESRNRAAGKIHLRLRQVMAAAKSERGEGALKTFVKFR